MAANPFSDLIPTNKKTPSQTAVNPFSDLVPKGKQGLGSKLLSDTKDVVAPNGGTAAPKSGFLPRMEYGLKSLGQGLWGVATGTVAPIEGALAAGADWLENKAGITNVSPSEVLNRTESAIQYTPKTQMGREFTKAASLPIKLAGDVGEPVGNWVFEKTDSPALATAAQMLPDAALMLGGAKAGEESAPRAKVAEAVDRAPEGQPPASVESKGPATGPFSDLVPEGNQTTAPIERRTDLARRKKVSEMTPEEMRQELYTSEATHLPNKRALLEKSPAPFHAAVDADSLKYVNDNLGHEAGDQMLHSIGNALNTAGLDAYHVSGDEFVVRGDHPEAIHNGLKSAQSELSNQTVSGSGLTHTPQISWGLGKSLGEADTALRQAKLERELAGLRASRGEKPPEMAHAEPSVTRAAYDAAASEQGNELADTPEGRNMAAVVEEGRRVLGRDEVARISEENDSSDEKFINALQEAINGKRAEEGGVSDAGQSEEVNGQAHETRGPENASPSEHETTGQAIAGLPAERLPVPTDNVEHSLHIVRNQRSLDVKAAQDYAKEAQKAGMTPEDNRVFMDYIEQANLPENQRTITMTPRQQDLFNRFIAPLREELGHSPGYVPREAIGKRGAVDLMVKGVKRTPGVGTMRKTLPSMKHRVFKAITDENGNRDVAAVKREGNAYRVLGFKNGQPRTIGRITKTTAEDELAARVKPMDDEIRKLRGEKSILNATKSRRQAATVRLRNIDNRINDLLAAKEQAAEDMAHLNGTYFKSGGKRFQIGEATAREIEQHTGVRYHRNLIGKLLNEWVANRQVQRQGRFLDELKQAPEFQQIATQDPSKAPHNWRSVNLPQFHGYLMEPYTAEVLNHYAAKVRGEGRVPYLGTVNDLLRKAMFSVLPLWHDLNLTDIGIINRGVSGWATPKGLYSFTKTLFPAIKEVMTVGPKYERLMEKGAPFMSVHNHIGLVSPDAFSNVVVSIGTELAEKPELHPIAKSLGYAPHQLLKVAKLWGRHAQSSIWTFNDVVAMQSIMEHERRGLSEDDALKRTFEVLPNYQLPEGSRLLNIVTHPDVSWFARYHLGLFKAYGKVMERAFGRWHSGRIGDRAKAWDQLAMVGLLQLVAYPMLDQIIRKQSGNPKSHVARFGLSAVPYDLWRMSQGQMNFVDMATRIFTPAPGTYEALQQIANRDFWSGDEIAPWYESKGTQWLDRAKHLTNANIPLANYLEGHTPGQGLARQIGIDIPPTRYEKAREAIKEKMERERKIQQYYASHLGLLPVRWTHH